MYRFLAQLRSIGLQDPPITPWLVPAWVTWWLPFCDIRNWLNLIQHSPSNLVTKCKNSIVTKVVDPMSPTMHFPSLPQRIRVFFEANTYFYVLDIFELNSTHLRLVVPVKIMYHNFCQHYIKVLCQRFLKHQKDLWMDIWARRTVRSMSIAITVISTLGRGQSGVKSMTITAHSYFNTHN